MKKLIIGGVALGALFLVFGVTHAGSIAQWYSGGTGGYAAGNILFGTGSYTPAATSTPNITTSGQLSTVEVNQGTSTAMVVDWNTTPNQVLLRVGSASFSIAFNNASTSGMTKRIIVCNPPTSAAGAITWNGTNFSWIGGAVPTQTTTAGNCDVWSFLVSAATSTQKVMGALSPGFQ